MKFKFQLSTKVYFGINCIKENGSELIKLGNRAFIVTGKTSARLSGALNDVLDFFQANNIEYVVYDDIGNNPTLENVNAASIEAKKFKADYIIGIGGGSPLDAAKAVAVLSTNNIEPLALFGNIYTNKPLPIVAIPTTAGTGSEVTQYSILTRHDLKTKMGFGNDDTYPKLAFLDARYILSMSYEVKVNTAVDAFSHALEGYLSKRSTPLTDIMAIEAISLFGECRSTLEDRTLTITDSEKLLYASMLAGMVISHTGTTIIHGMGYSLTYFKGIPHGKANGLLMREYLLYNYEYAKLKIDNILCVLKFNDINEFGNYIEKLFNTELKLEKEEMNNFARLSMVQKSTSFNIRTVAEEDLRKIFETCFGG